MMKTIINLFISFFICITLPSAAQKSFETRKEVILQTNDKATTQLLTQSTKIISNRLKIYGLEANVSIVADRGQIKVLLPENVILSEIEGLLTSRGELAFYETLTLNGFPDSVKINKTGNPILVRSDIETIKSSRENNSKSYKIEIKFLPVSANIWANATKNNLDKPIAIVIDDKVLYTPVVRSPIENGMCEITGNLTQKDVNYFLALVNNEPLPLRLNLLK